MERTQLIVLAGHDPRFIKTTNGNAARYIFVRLADPRICLAASGEWLKRRCLWN